MPKRMRSRRQRGRPSFKRRKTRSYRSSRKGYASTGQWGKPYSFGFRKKKTSKRRWRSIILRDTEAKTHYRCISSGFQPVFAASIGTPNVAAVFMFPALQTVNSVFQPFHTAGTEFWFAGGGAQNPDLGVAVPTFTGDITLRGGIARLCLQNFDNVAQRVKVWAVWAKPKPQLALYNLVNNTNQPIEWDPTVVPEFSIVFGRIMYMKQAMLAEQGTFEIIHRFKPQKIDRLTFRGDATQPAGEQLWWVLSVAPLQPNGVSAAVNTVNSYNLSFSADAV